VRRSRVQNSVSGRKAKAAGSALEAFLDIQHQIARRLGILARIDKIDPPAVMRNGRVEFGERTGADYIGMLERAPLLADFIRDGGFPPSTWALLKSVQVSRYLAVEAKSTADERFYKSDVKPKQQQHLTEVAAGGGLALLVVEFRWPNSGQVWRFAFPWLEVPWTKLKSADSIGVGQSTPWLIVKDDASCYLERFHPRGTSSTPVHQRQYSRE
jgi:hypothetical protein